MSDSVRKLTVSLYLESGQFEKNIKLMGNEIRQAEAEFKRASAGNKEFESTLKGMRLKAKSLTKQLSAQKQAVSQYKKQLEALKDKQSDQLKLYDQLKEERDQEVKKLKKSEKALESYRRALEKLEDSDDANQFDIQLAKSDVERAQGRVDEYRASVERLNGKMQAQASSMASTKQAVTRVSASYEEARAKAAELKSELNLVGNASYRVGTAMEEWAEKAQTVTKKVEGLGSTLTKNVTTPILSLGVAAAKAGIDYEDAFASVRKTVDATGEDAEEFFDSLSDSILDMSKRLATGAGDIAEVMSIAGQLGIENDQLESFTETIVRLGMSTNMAGEEAASAMAKFANITGMEQSEFSNMGATLVDLGNHFATTESDIMDMAENIAAAGAQVGLTEPQILGFAAALSSLGLEASAGGTAFSKALKKMETAVATDNDQLEDFAKVAGVTEEAFKELWTSDPAGAFEAFIVGLSKMDEEGIGAIATLDEIGFSEIRLSDTLLRTANATELLSEAQTMANESWAAGTALVNESDVKLQTTASRLTNVKNSLVAVGVQFADTMAPIIETVVKKLEAAVAWFGNLDESTRRNIVTWAACAAAIGPATKAVGMFGTATTKIIGGIGKFSKKMAEAANIITSTGNVTQALSKLIAPGGVMMLGLAAAAAAVAALYVQYKRLEDAKPDFSLDTDDIEKYAIDAEQLETDVTVDTSVDFTGDIETLHDKLIGELTDGVRETEEDRRAMSEAVQGVVDSVYEELENAIAEKRENIEQSYALGLIDEDAYNEATAALIGQGDTLKNDLTEKGDAITAYVTALSQSNKKMTEEEIATLNELLEALGAAADAVNTVTAAQTDAYKFAYEKTRLGYGSEEDQRMALEYIELLASRKIKEIEAEKAALEETAAATTEGMDDEQKAKSLGELNRQLGILDAQIASINQLKVQGFGEVLEGILSDADISAEELEQYQRLINELARSGIDLTDGLSFLESMQIKIGDDELKNWLDEADELAQKMDDSGLFGEDSPLKTMLATLADQGLIPAESLDNTRGLINVLAELNAQVQPTLDAVGALESETATDAENIMQGMTNAIYDGKSGVVGAMEDVAEELGDVMPTELDMHSPSRKLYNQGYNAMLGFRNGVLAGRAGVISAMRDAARAAVNAAKEELQIHSPSRVFEDEVGVMSMKGFGRGITKETKKQAATIRNAAKYLTREAQGGSTMNDNRRTYNSESNVTVTGNTFVVNDRQDVQSLAVEIASLTRQNQRGRGLRMA